MDAVIEAVDPVLAHRMLNSLNVLAGVLRVMEDPRRPADAGELCQLAYGHADRMAAALHALMRGDPASALAELSPPVPLVESPGHVGVAE